MDSPQLAPLQKSFIYLISGVLVTLFTGWVFFGTDIFSVRQPVFAFTSLGVTGSVFLSLLLVRRFRDAIFLSILLFLLNLLISHSRFLVTQFFFFGGCILAVTLYWARIYGNGRSWRWMRPLSLSALFAVISVINTVVLGLIYRGNISHPLINVPVSFLVGLGLGLGFEVGDELVQRMERITQSDPSAPST